MSTPPDPLSRRDFLRRAGREAAQTGVKVIPGAGLVSAAVKTPWWEKVALWRRERGAPEADTPPAAPESDTAEDTDAPNEKDSPNAQSDD